MDNSFERNKVFKLFILFNSMQSIDHVQISFIEINLMCKLCLHPHLFPFVIPLDSMLQSRLVMIGWSENKRLLWLFQRYTSLTAKDHGACVKFLRFVAEELGDTGSLWLFPQLLHITVHNILYIYMYIKFRQWVGLLNYMWFRFRLFTHHVKQILIIIARQ